MLAEGGAKGVLLAADVLGPDRLPWAAPEDEAGVAFFGRLRNCVGAGHFSSKASRT